MGRVMRIKPRSPSNMIEETTTLKSDSRAPSGRVHPLVRQIRKALKSTKRMMFWDIELDESDVIDSLKKCEDSNYTAAECIESVIEGVIMSHEQTLKDAVADQCRCATRAALSSLPNVPDETTPDLTTK